jgi:hypothetical protein
VSIPQAEQECSNCRFYYSEADRCRRYAPRPQMGEGYENEGAFFPVMFSDEWCGEWEYTGPRTNP